MTDSQYIFVDNMNPVQDMESLRQGQEDNNQNKSQSTSRTWKKTARRLRQTLYCHGASHDQHFRWYVSVRNV